MSQPTKSETFSVTAARTTAKTTALALTAAALTGAFVWAMPLRAQAQETNSTAPAATSFSDAQKSEIEAIVKGYLLKNPEVFLEIQNALEAKMEQAQAEQLKTALATHAEALFRNPNAPVSGNPKGDVTVVEFFDYNCGYCKRGFTDVAKLIEQDPKVRVVFLELPILSKDSEEASRVAIAANMQGKYWDFHSLMISHRGKANKGTAMSIAKRAGLDMDQLKKDLKSPVIDGEIKRVRQLAQDLNINGTPHFIVGNRSIPGAPQDLLEQLKSDLALVRKEGCTTC